MDVRIGVASAGDPDDRAGYSGWPASLLAGLEAVVEDAVPLSGAVGVQLRRMGIVVGLLGRARPGEWLAPRAVLASHRQAAVYGRPVIALRSLGVRRRLARAGRLDGCVLHGTAYRLPQKLRSVTFEDSTVIQAARAYPWPYLRGFSPRDLDRCARRQAQTYERAVACTTASHWAARSIVDDYGVPREKVHVVGAGPNHVVEPPVGRDWSIPRYLFVGVDWERKNGAAVLAAFARVRERYPAATLDLVGRHPRVEAEGVTAHGPLSLAENRDRERTATLYRRATVFVMPSLHEPAGSVHIEAGYAGIPSIGSADGGAGTLIGPGGCVVDPRDSDQITRAMLRLADPGHAMKLGARAREHAQLFTWRRVTERLVRALAVPGMECSGLADFL
jgi:glycosyltransferase involved in cell wall biosynthesis